MEISVTDFSAPIHPLYPMIQPNFYIEELIQIVENTDQGKFCSPLIVSSFSITKGLFIRETNAKNIWSDSFLLAIPYAY